MQLSAKSTRQNQNSKKQNKIKIESPTVIGRGLVAFWSWKRDSNTRPAHYE